MSKKQWKLVNSALAITVYLFSPARGFADDFQYFKSGVDYWNESKDEKKNSNNVKSEPANKPTDSEAAFPWANFIDPKNKEFFREGDYLPPEPFMELVRNPSDENIKMWFSYMEKKNELAQRLEVKVAQYAEKNGLAEPQKEQMKAAVGKTGRTSIDSKRYRFRMYYSSTCPHCQKMMGTLNELQNKGFFVEARQIDSGKGVLQLPFPSEPATKAELSEKGVQSVPLLLVGDLKNKVVYRLSGYQTTENVLSALSQNDTEAKAQK